MIEPFVEKWNRRWNYCKNFLANYLDTVYLKLLNCLVHLINKDKEEDTLGKITSGSLSEIPFLMVLKRSYPSLFLAAAAASSFRSEAKKAQLFINTPLVSSVFRVGEEAVNLHFKLENLQPSGSFKDRGIGHMISSLVQEDDVGRLVSSSGGNGLYKPM